MKNINIEKIFPIISDFVKERDWEQFHSIKNLSMALSVETSELLEIFQWLREDESNRITEDPKLKMKVEEEIADIFIYLLRIAMRTNIDIEEAVINKMKKNAEKYPLEKSKGNAKKYTDF